MIGSQPTLPEFSVARTRAFIGKVGEILVAQSLEMQGYQVRIDHEFGDLTVISPDGEITYVEVKSSQRNKDKKFHFTLYKYWQGRLCTDHRNADVLVLLCLMKRGNAIPFVIPVTEVGDRKAATVCGNPRQFHSWLSDYRSDIKRLRLPRKED